MLHMPSDHVVIITRREAFLSVTFRCLHGFAGSKGITKFSRALPWLFPMQTCFAPFDQVGRQ